MSLERMENELVVQEVEIYRLDIFRLTSTHSLCSGTKFQERGWTLFHSRVAHGEKRRAGVGLFIASWFAASMLEIIPVNKRVISFQL